MHRHIERLVVGATVFLGVASILLASLHLLLASTSFERYIFSRVPTLEAMGGDERQLVAAEIRSFLFQRNPLSESLFDDTERRHMLDVRGLIDLSRWVLLVALTGCVIGLYGSRPRLRPSSRVLWRVGVAGLFVSLAGLVASAVAFPYFFTKFHYLLFANDDWLLDPTRHALIQAYPPKFFYVFFLGAIVCASILCALSMMLGRLLRAKASS